MALGDKKKLDRFADAVLADATARAEKIRSETREKEEAMLKVGKEKISEELTVAAEAELRELMAENSRALSELDRDIRRRSYLLREQACNETMREVASRLEEYSQCSEYREFLCKKCVDVLSMQSCCFTVYLAPKDMSYSLDILKALSQKPDAAAKLVGIESDESIVLGGAKFVGSEKSILIDMTLDTALESRRGYLSTLVARAGDMNG